MGGTQRTQTNGKEDESNRKLCGGVPKVPKPMVRRMSPEIMEVCHRFEELAAMCTSTREAEPPGREEAECTLAKLKELPRNMREEETSPGLDRSILTKDYVRSDVSGRRPPRDDPASRDSTPEGSRETEGEYEYENGELQEKDAQDLKKEDTEDKCELAERDVIPKTKEETSGEEIEEYLEMGVRRWERPDEDNPALDNAVDIDSETTGRNRDVKLSGLGMSSRSATLEAPREVNAITLGQLPLELIRAEVSKMKGDWRAPSADAAMRPCHQDLRRGKNKLGPGSPSMPRVDGINTVVGGVEAPKENSNTTLPENRGEKPDVSREEDDPLCQWREHQDPWKTLGERESGAEVPGRGEGTRARPCLSK